MSGTTTKTVLWLNENTGEILCGDLECHGGYMKAALTHQPRARRHVTPLGTWFRATAAEVEYLTSVNLGCAYCGVTA